MSKKDDPKQARPDLLGRRKFLRQVGTGAAAAITVKASPIKTISTRLASSDILDVAIIGAGVSGAYSAWELTEGERRRQGRPRFQHVHLFELSDRIGGRLLTVTPEGMPHMRAELGGMRFSPRHKRVMSLIDKLGLGNDVVPFQPKGKTARMYYLRGRSLCTDQSVKELWKVSFAQYWLKGKEEGMTLEQLVELAFDKVGPNPKHADWPNEKRMGLFAGQHLYDTGFWNVLAANLSPEAIHLLHDAMGYHSIFSNWNAGEAMEWFTKDFGHIDYNKLRKGYEELPKRLIEQFTHAGGVLRLGCALLALAPNVSYGGRRTNRLTFADGKGGRTRQVYADRVILALPKRALEILSETNRRYGRDNPVLVKIRENLNAVTAQAAFKLFLGYDAPWWYGHRTGGCEGQSWWYSSTDLPIRQTYYLGPDDEQPEASRQNRNSLVLASYCDAQAVSFWQGLTGSHDPAFASHARRASKAMIQAAQTQIAMAHGGVEIPAPYVAFYQDWSQDPYGGGWHFWNPKVKPWEVMPAMRHPDREARVFVCGEAYSSDQGWVEGALQSAESLLNEHFGLKGP